MFHFVSPSSCMYISLILSTKKSLVFKALGEGRGIASVALVNSCRNFCLFQQNLLCQSNLGLQNQQNFRQMCSASPLPFIWKYTPLLRLKVLEYAYVSNPSMLFTYWEPNRRLSIVKTEIGCGTRNSWNRLVWLQYFWGQAPVALFVVNLKK